MPSKFGGIPVDSSDAPKSKFGGIPVNQKKDEDPSRSFFGSMSDRFSQGWKDLSSPAGDYQPTEFKKDESAGDYVRRAAKRDIAEGVNVPLKMLGGVGQMASAPAGAVGETLERKAALAAGLSPKDAEIGARKTGDVASMIPIVPLFKGAPKIASSTLETGGKALKGVREAINARSDVMATKVPLDKEHAYIVKVLKKDGHSPEDITNIFKMAKDRGMSIGQASGNPVLLGMERKISGLNKPGGKIIRDFAKDQADPKNNLSLPFKLKSIADPLVKKVEEASKQIGVITEKAPKTPVRMTSIESSLAKEARPPKSTVSNTLGRIDGLVDWAKSQGGTFADWHRVKQEIWNLKSEAKDPNAVEKLDVKTVNKYYKKVNDVLSGKSPGLPSDLQKTAQEYRLANENFAKNLSGRIIQEVLNKMPTGGTPASKLKYLHKQLAGNAELQEELFSGMPKEQQEGMTKLLEAIEKSGRSGTSDVVKSMEAGTPTFPFSKSSALHKMYSAVADAITRKDYDALANALTSPDAELIARKFGYVKMAPPTKPILRLTYQPKAPEIAVTREGEARMIPRHEQVQIDQARDRLENLGIRTDHFRVQDMKTVRELEQKYGQSELGKFVIANRHTPFIDKAWEIPKTEYNQATIDRMMRNSAWNKLDEMQQERINIEMEKAWNSHQLTLADMILSARQAAEELSKVTGEPKIGSVGNALLEAINPESLPISK